MACISRQSLYIFWQVPSNFSVQCFIQSLKAMHCTLNLHAKKKTQTEKKTFSIIFLQYMRHCTWVRSPRSNSQVCKCLAVWSPACSVIFLYLSFSILENRDCITCPSLNLDSCYWLKILTFLKFVTLRFGKLRKQSINVVSPFSENCHGESTEEPSRGP